MMRKNRPAEKFSMRYNLVHHVLTGDKNDDWKQEITMMRKNRPAEKFSVRHGLIRYGLSLPKTKDEFFKNNTESHSHSKSQRMQIGKWRLAGMRIPFKIASADALIG